MRAGEPLLVYEAFPIDGDRVLLQRAGAPAEPGAGAPATEVAMPLVEVRRRLASDNVQG